MENVLLDKSVTPDINVLEKSLSESYKYYTKINEITVDYEKEWKYYGKKYGWKYKIHNDNKMLLDFSVLKEGFLLVLAIRENEWNDIFENDENAALNTLLSNDGIKHENYGIKIIVTNEKTFETAKAIIEYMISRR